MAPSGKGIPYAFFIIFQHKGDFVHYPLWLSVFVIINPFHLKLPILLFQYLREQKTLSLPGIGTFHLTGTVAHDNDSAFLNASQVQFESKKIKEHDDKLISFIKQETGKIKPLAIADLETYIAAGMEMLNMGKPFQLEGIGSIQKKRDGQYEFTAGESGTVRHEPSPSENEKRVSVYEDSKYEPRSNPLQRILAFGLLLAGLGIVLLGGYYLYNRNNNTNSGDQEAAVSQPPIQQSVVDSSTTKKDSVVEIKGAETYKFLLETKSGKATAIKRYKQLRSLPTDIRMETSDSTVFRLYFLLPSSASDTARIKDSLSNYYGKRVRIEY
jgi:hypothetical protein